MSNIHITLSVSDESSGESQTWTIDKDQSLAIETLYCRYKELIERLEEYRLV